MRTNPVHLLWAVPVAAVLQLVALVPAHFTWCGFSSSCAQVGFWTPPDAPATAGVLLAAAVIGAVVVALAPWHPVARTRKLTAALVGTALFGVSFAWVSSLGPLGWASAG